MYVGKRIKSVLSVLLIIGLLVVSVPCRAYAVGPVVLGPALKYAIGAGIVAGGLYAANNDDLTYAINDYWNKASDYVKQQWQSVVTYGTGIGIIVLNSNLNAHLKNYLEDNFNPGVTQAYEYVPGVELGIDITYSKLVAANGDKWKTSTSNGFYYLILNNEVVATANTNTNSYSWVKYLGTEAYFRLNENGHPVWCFEMEVISGKYGDVIGSIVEFVSLVSTSKPLSYWETSTGDMVVTYDFVGDAAGFGNATEGRPDIKIPCPPVPAAEWPDTWLDNLLDDLNRTGNPTLDDETFVEECEREWDWYWDDNVAYIYRVPHGDPPRDPDDEPIRIPIPPPPQPEIPFPQPDPIPQPAEPCPYCPPNPYPSPDGQPCPNPYCPNQPNPMPVPVPYSPNVPAEPCPYCPPNPYPLPDGQPCPNPYCPNQPNQQPVPTPPPDIQPFYDDPEINWEPLRRSLYELTEKFPFSLPWDLMRGVQSMEANQWDRKIRVVIGDEFWPNFEIDLTMFDRLARISRVIMLVIFDLGLIFATRKLMGGDV